MAGRWQVPVTLVVAPGGYGKSTVVAQAIVDNDLDPSGIDVYRSYRPGLGGPVEFATAIMRSLDRLSDRPERAMAPPVDPVRVIVDAIDRLAPQQVCLHIDDVDLLVTNRAIGSTISKLVKRMPSNGHLVLIARRTPALDLPASTLTIGVDELAFTPAEVADLVVGSELDETALRRYHGWPALSRLAVVAGDTAPQQFIVEEVLPPMTATERSAIATLVMAGQLDSELADLVGLPGTLLDLATNIPLVDLNRDGSISAADLWSDVIDAVIEQPERKRLAGVIGPWLAAAGRSGDAIGCAANAGLWSLAREFVMSAAAGGDPGITPSATRQWLALFPSDQLAEPELVFLRGLHTRLLHGAGSGKDDVVNALAMFDERGMAEAASVAAVELGVQGWLTGDVALLTEIMSREEPEEISSRPDVSTLNRLGYAAEFEMGGNYGSANELVADIDVSGLPKSLAELVLRYSVGAAFRVGDSAHGVARVAELLALNDSPSTRFLAGVTSFEHGDPSGVRRWSAERYPREGNRRDDFWAAAWSCLIDGAFGLEPRFELVESLAWERKRERCYVAVARAVAAIVDGSEETAAAGMRALVEDIGVVDPVSEGELRRFLVYVYVLVPEVRAHFDDQHLDPPLGPLHIRRINLAKILVALRAGEEPNWAGYEGPEATFCAFPLPWALELACALFTKDQRAGDELGSYLLAVGGQRAQQALRQVAASSDPQAEATGALLAATPAPPAEATHLQLCGPPLVRRGQMVERHPRARVRQLLALLVLRRSLVRSEAARLLWPNMEPARAGQNLRVTLSALRRYLEPDRRKGERSYHLRDIGDSLVLEPNELLTCDVWDIEQLLNTATALATETDAAANGPDDPDDPSDPDAAIVQAVALWAGPILAELDDVTEVRGAVDRLRAGLAAAAVGAAERMVQAGRIAAARAVAERVVEDDPYNEPARAVVIASLIDEEQYVAAGRAIDALLSSLAELAVEPSDLTRMLIKRLQHRSSSRR